MAAWQLVASSKLRAVLAAVVRRRHTDQARSSGERRTRRSRRASRLCSLHMLTHLLRVGVGVRGRGRGAYPPARQRGEC